METNLQKIQRSIADSALSQDEQDDFITLLAMTADSELGPVVGLFSVDKSWATRMYQNIRLKRDALATGDSAQWQKVIQEEEAQLKELEQ